RLTAVVVAPDDLVQERLASENLVQEQLAVMSLAVVDVEIERSVRGEQHAHALQTRPQEFEVAGEAVVEAEGAQQARAVGATAKPDPPRLQVCLHRHGVARAWPARVEG